MELEQYRNKNPAQAFECMKNHRYSTDRACEECGYGIWTDCIKCPHCGADNECAECNPELNPHYDENDWIDGVDY